MKQDVYLLVGSNVGKESNYPAAIREIASFGEVMALSPVYETQPVGMPTADTFFNGAVWLRTSLAAGPFKTKLISEVEEPLGRVRNPSGPPQPPTIDVDIAFWGDLCGEIAGRPVPHPDILRYLHAARPLADIAPNLAHPQTGQTMAGIAHYLAATSPLPRPRPDVILSLD